MARTEVLEARKQRHEELAQLLVATKRLRDALGKHGDVRREGANESKERDEEPK